MTALELLIWCLFKWIDPFLVKWTGLIHTHRIMYVSIISMVGILVGICVSTSMAKNDIVSKVARSSLRVYKHDALSHLFCFCKSNVIKSYYIELVKGTQNMTTNLHWNECVHGVQARANKRQCSYERCEMNTRMIHRERVCVCVLIYK